MTNIENNDEMMLEGTTDNRVFLSKDGEEFVSSEVQEIIGLDGDDTIESAINAKEPGSTIFGNAGNDYIRSRGIGDRVFGGRGNDTIINENGKAIIYGDLGNDVIIANDSNTTVFGGRSFGEPSAEDGENILWSFGGKNILIGGGGNDSIIGNVGNDTMAGGNGDDTIRSGPVGKSFLFGNKGKDFIFSRAQDNPDTMFGGQGNDVIEVTAESTADAPLLFGGVGDDSLMVMGSVNNAILVADVNPDGTFGGSDGDEGNNYLFIKAGEGHQLFGNAGNDTLELGVNVTTRVSMFGGRGDDYIFGGSDASYSELQIFGGRGSDTIMFEGSVSQSVIWGDNNFSTEGFGDNVIIVSGDGNTLRGGNDNTTPENAGQNKITLAAGSDNLLIGGPGGDFLSGSGAGENNTLQGGVGNDTFFFGKNQTITSEGGANFYRGFGADKGQEVEVTTQDDIAGEANFVVRGDASGFREIEKGGVRTPDTDKRQSISITVDASGTTRTGGGDDIFELGSVSGLVTSSAGNNTFTVRNDVTETGAVIGGSGSDTIRVQGAVQEGGSVSGGDGNDNIFANVVESGAVIDGGEGADTIEVNELFGVVKGGGLGNNIFTINQAFAGAQIWAGAEANENIILGAIGTSDSDDPIIIKGGMGDNKLGFGSASTGIGSDMARLEIDGVGGDNVIQGTPFGKDILKGGAGADVLYGGVSNFVGRIGANAATADQLGQIGLKIGDGDQLISGGGKTTFLFQTWNETGSVQSNFAGITITEAPDGDMEAYVLSIGTAAAVDDVFDEALAESILAALNSAPDQFNREEVLTELDSDDFNEVENGFDWDNTIESEDWIDFLENNLSIAEALEITTAQSINFDAITPGFNDDATSKLLSAGFHVDTLTNFNYESGANNGDRIFLSNDPGNFSGLAGSITQFSSTAVGGDGFLFGAIGTSDADVTNAGDIIIGTTYFNSSFVVSNNADARTAINNAIGQPNSVLFDRSTGGLYLSPGNSTAYLVAVLDGHNIPENEVVDASSIFTVGPVGQALGPTVEIF